MKSKSISKKAWVEPLPFVSKAVVVVRRYIGALRTESGYVDILEVEKRSLKGGGKEFWHDVDGHDVGGARDIVWVDFTWVHVRRGVPVKEKRRNNI